MRVLSLINNKILDFDLESSTRVTRHSPIAYSILGTRMGPTQPTH